MIKREALFTTRFKKWLKLHSFVPYASVYEIKVTPNNRIPFNAVKLHQTEALLAVKNGRFLYKIPDAGWQNPFDLIFLANQHAFVVLAFTHKGKKADVFLVDIELFIQMRQEAEDFGVKSCSVTFLDNYSREHGDRCQHHSI